jgi:putative transposase
MDASMISQMKAIEDKNRRLKKMFAELSMQNELLKEALGKNRSAISTPGDSRKSSQAAGRQYCFGLPDLRGERDLLSLRSKA